MKFFISISGEEQNTELYLEKTTMANQHLSAFCTAMNKILDDDDAVV
jgi:hypothetical protein